MPAFRTFSQHGQDDQLLPARLKNADQNLRNLSVAQERVQPLPCLLAGKAQALLALQGFCQPFRVAVKRLVLTLDKLFQAFAQASHQVRIRYLDLCQLLDDIGNRCFQLLA